jgi:excisionase family DNA binding protein
VPYFQRTITMIALPPRLFVETAPAPFIEPPAPAQGPVTGSEKPAARVLPQMFSIAEVAEMFGRAPRTIRSWIERGLLKPVKVGNSVFIPQDQIDALLSATDPPKSGPRQRRKAPVT